MFFFANRVFVDQVSVNVVKTTDSVLHTGGYPLVDLSLEPTENLEKRYVEFPQTWHLCVVFIFSSEAKSHYRYSPSEVSCWSHQIQKPDGPEIMCVQAGSDFKPSAAIWFLQRCKLHTHVFAARFSQIWDCVKCLKQPWLPRTCQNGNVETKELVEKAPLLVKKSPFILFTSLGHGQTSWNEFVSWRCNFCTLLSYAFKFAVWPDMTRHWEMCLGFLWASGLELQTCCIETRFFQRKNVSTTSYTFWGLMFRFKESFLLVIASTPLSQFNPTGPVLSWPRLHWGRLQRRHSSGQGDQGEIKGDL